MMYYHPSGYIIFSLRKLNFIGARGRGLGTGGWGLDMRVEGGYESQGLDNPNTLFCTSFEILHFGFSANRVYIFHLFHIYKIFSRKIFYIFYFAVVIYPL